MSNSRNLADLLDSTGDVKSAALDNVAGYTHPTGAGNEHIPTGGTPGQIIVNTSSGTGNWQDMPESGGGKVLQMVTKTEPISFTTTSATPVDTGFSLDITPKSDNSDLLIMANVSWASNESAPTGAKVALGLGADTSTIGGYLSAISRTQYQGFIIPITRKIANNNLDAKSVHIKVGVSFSKAIYMPGTQTITIFEIDNN